MSESTGGRIGLAEMISTLRAELDKAQKAAPESSPLEVREIDLEVSFTHSREGTAKGGVKFWVYEAGVEGKLASERVHKVTLRLGPKEGTSIQVSRTVDHLPR